MHGDAAAGGSDIATCCDFIVMEDTACIGYMPVRGWGCPTPAMWVYRVGAMRAKRLMLTGDLIDGNQAYEWGLATDVAPIDQFDACVNKLAERIAGVPKNQLMMLKLVINQAIDAMGLEHTQMVATVFDGITRHSPEGLWFKRYAEEFGFRAAVEWRDSGRPDEVSASACAKRTATQAPLHRGRCAGQQQAGPQHASRCGGPKPFRTLSLCWTAGRWSRPPAVRQRRVRRLPRMRHPAPRLPEAALR